jgi:hypothetical protein
MTPALDLDTLVLLEGSHKTAADGMCVMEAVAYIAGEPFGDHPECVSPIIGEFLRSWNDGLPDDAARAMLKPLIEKVIGTRTNAADEETRAWMVTDWLARECAPGFLRLAGLTDQAILLEHLGPLTSSAIAAEAQPTLDRARKEAVAARDAAWAAARAAARDAARAAARAAAESGGDYKAQYDAAYKAAKPLVDAKFGPTTKGLQASALLLVERMCDVGREPIRVE